MCSRSLRKHWRYFSLITLILVGAPGAGFAQAVTTAELEATARRAYERREFAVAARAFEAASAASPRAALTYNAALAWELAGDPARAVDAYEAALAAGLEPSFEASAHARIAKLAPALGVVELAGPAGLAVRIDGDGRGTLRARIHVSPGSHEASLDAAGFAPESHRFAVAPGEVTTVTFDGRKREAPPAPAAIAPPGAAPPAIAPRGVASQRIAGFVGIGAGVVAGVVGAVLYAKAVAANDTWKESNLIDLRAHDAAVSDRTGAWIAAGVAAGAAVVGGVLVLTSPSRAQQVSVRLSPAFTGIRVVF